MKKVFYFVALILLFAFLVWASRNPLWKYHLAFDISTFYSRYSQFFKTNSFSGFGSNEYLPVSLFLFILPGIFGRNLGWESFFNIFTVINLLFIIGHLYLYRLINKKSSLILPLILFAATGPILIFRFELFVSFLFLLSIYLFVRKKYILSGILLGLSIATKIYPVFALPYFLIILIKNKNLKNAAEYFLSLILAVLAPVYTYLVLKGNPGDLLKNLVFHVDKPIGLESLTSSFIALPVFIKTHVLPHIINANGVWGLPNVDFVLISLLPYAAMGAVYLSLLIVKWKKKIGFNPAFVILVIAVFLLTSKYLNPQYMVWIFGLVPLISFSKSWRDRLFIVNSIVILVLTQLTYPIFFWQILGSFGSSKPDFSYWLLEIRNLLLLVEIPLLWRLAF